MRPVVMPLKTGRAGTPATTGRQICPNSVTTRYLNDLLHSCLKMGLKICAGGVLARCCCIFKRLFSEGRFIPAKACRQYGYILPAWVKQGRATTLLPLFVQPPRFCRPSAAGTCPVPDWLRVCRYGCCRRWRQWFG